LTGAARRVAKARMTPYRAPAWLPGGHLQTIYPALLMPRPALAYRRERWETPDGDFIDLDRIEPSHGSSREPFIVLFHGLEGCSTSHYALALMAALRARGWRGAVVHFRGCSGEANRLPRAYHSGDSEEIDWILRRLQDERAGRPLYAAGVSLGGNALLKWLGERGDAAAGLIDRACAVSAPVDLMSAGNALGRGFNRVYTRHFLATLRRKSLRMLERHPGLFDRDRVLAARTLRQFDDVVTAPLHGFRDTDDYWRRASAKPLLGRIAVRTLMLNARNDPFLPRAALPAAHEVSTRVMLEYPETGGHAGFVRGRFPGRLDWLPQRMLGFFSGN
jgi:predicted alpha/beta-fold hydrolase